MAAAPLVLRVFISSTVGDMQGEREELVKRVFPEIRRRCEERGVVWGEVDLRWEDASSFRAATAYAPFAARPSRPTTWRVCATSSRRP